MVKNTEKSAGMDETAVAELACAMTAFCNARERLRRQDPYERQRREAIVKEVREAADPVYTALDHLGDQLGQEVCWDDLEDRNEIGTLIADTCYDKSRTTEENEEAMRREIPLLIERYAKERHEQKLTVLVGDIAEEVMHLYGLRDTLFTGSTVNLEGLVEQVRECEQRALACIAELAGMEGYATEETSCRGALEGVMRMFTVRCRRDSGRFRASLTAGDVLRHLMLGNATWVLTESAGYAYSTAPRDGISLLASADDRSPGMFVDVRTIDAAVRLLGRVLYELTDNASENRDEYDEMMYVTLLDECIEVMERLTWGRGEHSVSYDLALAVADGILSPCDVSELFERDTGWRVEAALRDELRDI